MRRVLFILVAICSSTIVGAQGPTAIQPTQRLELFKKNRVVIENIVSRSVESTQFTENHLKRADSYYKILYQFNAEILQARKDKDEARVEELSRHLGNLLDKGLAPVLMAADMQVKGGTNAEEFPEVKKQLLSQLDALLKTIEETKTARKSIESAKQNLMKVGSEKAAN